ncbi:YhcH/YjgK/YiaL family protein [Rhodopirellula sp. MGV]|uniref:YhcH/YjgK/YiaL family protein n=1 Tax=Rhodopirellula sp. MGV TaxID=2023130 RepID=UPI000B95DCA9|nr:YhcH/YjgK/YiaL family protein [Rhodopirellula sp. MGV]OYP36590.1 hypothetical protein CGZ80_08145 [Rhodopirellula sp. MGV]PNY34567.1 DUF386 domain-containing protein [Rhodopirellula baltica]
MIVSTLAEAGRYQALHPRFAKAFEYLRSLSPSNFAEGRHEIDGDDLFAIAWAGFGNGQADAVLEAHRKYIDIQYVVSGFDVMGWRPLEACERPKQAYDAEKDLAFYFDRPDCWCRVPAGSFAIFYPEDVHAPLAATTSMKKVVVKVKLD